jgi:hypothetical protein
VTTLRKRCGFADVAIFIAQLLGIAGRSQRPLPDSPSKRTIRKDLPNHQDLSRRAVFAHAEKFYFKSKTPGIAAGGLQVDRTDL